MGGEMRSIRGSRKGWSSAEDPDGMASCRAAHSSGGLGCYSRAANGEEPPHGRSEIQPSAEWIRSPE
jgi:hypothetical protein